MSATATTVSADANQIIEQLKAGQAATNKAGLGGPEMDAFYEEVIRQIAKAPDPQARIREIADLITRERGRTSKAA